MAKKQKKMTVVQQKNRYRALQYTTFVSEFVSVLTPFIVMGAINADTWFQSEEGWKVGLGGALALALMGIAVALVTKNKDNKQKTSGYVTLIAGWFAVAFVFLLLSSILEQITTIMLFGGFGLLGAFGLDIVSKNFKKKADLYKSAIEKAKGKKLEEDIYAELVDRAKKEDSEIKF